MRHNSQRKKKKKTLGDKNDPLHRLRRQNLHQTLFSVSFYLPPSTITRSLGWRRIDLTDVLELMQQDLTELQIFLFVGCFFKTPWTIKAIVKSKSKIMKWITWDSKKMSLNLLSSELWTLEGSWKVTGGSALVSSVIINLCSHIRFSGAVRLQNPRHSQKCGVSSACEQREKCNTGSAIHVAYACHRELKLTKTPQRTHGREERNPPCDLTFTG